MQIQTIQPFQGFTPQPVPVEDPGVLALPTPDGEFADVLDGDLAADSPAPTAIRPEDAFPIPMSPPLILVAANGALAVVPLPETTGSDGEVSLELSLDAPASGAPVGGPTALLPSDSDNANPKAGSVAAVDVAPPTVTAAGRSGQVKDQATNSGDDLVDPASILAGKAVLSSADTNDLIAERAVLATPVPASHAAPPRQKARFDSQPISPSVDSGTQSQLLQMGSEGGASPESFPPEIGLQAGVSNVLLGNGKDALDPLGQARLPNHRPTMASVAPQIVAANPAVTGDRVVKIDPVALNPEADPPAARQGAAAGTFAEGLTSGAPPTLAGKSRDPAAGLLGEPTTSQPAAADFGAADQDRDTADPPEVDRGTTQKERLPIAVDAAAFLVGSGNVPADRPWSVAQHQVLGAASAVATAAAAEARPFGFDTVADMGLSDPARMAVEARISAFDVSGQISRAMVEKPGFVELTLTPEDLGRIRFEIQQNGEQVRMVLAAERPETLDHLRRHLPEFLADLRQSGFSGSDISFGQWSRGGGDSNPAWSGAFQDNQQNRHGQAANPWLRGDEAELVRPDPSARSGRNLDLGPGRLAIRV